MEYFGRLMFFAEETQHKRAHVLRNRKKQLSYNQPVLKAVVPVYFDWCVYVKRWGYEKRVSGARINGLSKTKY
jgi:hypothetical protein